MRTSQLAKGRRTKVPTACTIDSAIIARGWVRSMQLRTFFKPMPGSTSTGTAPSLNRAKATA